MPNRSSKAEHIPYRTCVICRKKEEKKNLLRFIIFEKEIIFDLKKILKFRGYYICDDNKCLRKLAKWFQKKKKKHI